MITVVAILLALGFIEAVVLPLIDMMAVEALQVSTKKGNEQ